MPREVDERKKRAALRKLRRAAELAEQGLGPPLTDWEIAFLEEVEARVEKYGSAFADPMKGAEGEAHAPASFSPPDVDNDASRPFGTAW